MIKKYKTKDREKRREYEKAWRAKNKEKLAKRREENRDSINEKMREWKRENKDKVAASAKKYQEKNSEKISLRKKKWKEKNAERIWLLDKQYREENKEKELARHKKYLEENRELILQRTKDYRENNREKYLKSSLISAHRRLAVKKNKPFLWGHDAMDLMFEYFEYKCAYCNLSPHEELDHYVPISNKHTPGWVPWNHVTSCIKCNRGIGGKCAKHPDDWVAPEIRVKIKKYFQLWFLVMGQLLRNGEREKCNIHHNRKTH